MRTEWQDDPKIRARMWVTYRLAEKGIGAGVIGQALGVTTQTIYNDQARLEAWKEVGGETGIKELADRDAARLQVDLLTEGIVRLTTTAMKERSRRPVLVQVEAAVAAMAEIRDIARAHGEEEEAKELDAMLQPMKAQLKRLEARKALKEAIKGVDPQIAPYLQDVVDIIERTNRLDAAARGER